MNDDERAQYRSPEETKSVVSRASTRTASTSRVAAHNAVKREKVDPKVEARALKGQ